MTRRYRPSGFTLIELMLAMAFISVLLLSITMTAIHVGKMYSRGATLRGINHAGRDVGDVLRRDFLQSDSRRVAQNGGDGVVIEIQDAGEMMSGRFCLGRYSYLWNVPRVIDEKLSNTAIVRGPDSKPINFVRVIDDDGVLCKEADGVYPNQLNHPERITNLLASPLDGDGVVLAIHSLRVDPVGATSGGSEALYRLQYTIGTSKLSELNTINQSCKPPTEEEANTEFCAINQFDTIVRTNG